VDVAFESRSNLRTNTLNVHTSSVSFGVPVAWWSACMTSLSFLENEGALMGVDVVA